MESKFVGQRIESEVCSKGTHLTCFSVHHVRKGPRWVKGSLQKCPGDYTAGDAGLAVDGEKNDIVDSFCHLDNMWSTERGQR